MKSQTKCQRVRDIGEKSLELQWNSTTNRAKKSSYERLHCSRSVQLPRRRRQADSFCFRVSRTSPLAVKKKCPRLQKIDSGTTTSGRFVFARFLSLVFHLDSSSTSSSSSSCCRWTIRVVPWIFDRTNMNWSEASGKALEIVSIEKITIWTLAAIKTVLLR